MNQPVDVAARQLADRLADVPRPRLLVTAGPTCEDIDAVRFLTNRSTGRMGIDIADAATARGWTPLLVLGPTALGAGQGVSVLPVRSAAQMDAAVQALYPWCDALVMTAAVADYTPAEPIAGKRAKEPGDWLLRLVRTPDILARVAERPDRAGRIVAGFSLGAEMDLEAARGKLARKRMDLIVANTSASFGSDHIDACILHADGREIAIGPVAKTDLAARLLDEISRRLPDA